MNKYNLKMKNKDSNLHKVYTNKTRIAKELNYNILKVILILILLLEQAQASIWPPGTSNSTEIFTMQDS